MGVRGTGQLIQSRFRDRPSQSTCSMAPKARAKPTIAKEKTAKPAKAAAGDVLDLPEIAKTLQEWQDAKKQISLIEKVQEGCKTKVEAAMAKHGVTSIKAKTLMVEKKMQSRTGVSAKDLPKDILDKYSKTSTFPVFSIKPAK